MFKSIVALTAFTTFSVALPVESAQAANRVHYHLLSNCRWCVSGIGGAPSPTVYCDYWGGCR